MAGVQHLFAHYKKAPESGVFFSGLRYPLVLVVNSVRLLKCWFGWNDPLICADFVLVEGFLREWCEQGELHEFCVGQKQFEEVSS